MGNKTSTPDQHIIRFPSSLNYTYLYEKELHLTNIYQRYYNDNDIDIQNYKFSTKSEKYTINGKPYKCRYERTQFRDADIKILINKIINIIKFDDDLFIENSLTKHYEYLSYYYIPSNLIFPEENQKLLKHYNYYYNIIGLIIASTYQTNTIGRLKYFINSLKKHVQNPEEQIKYFINLPCNAFYSKSKGEKTQLYKIYDKIKKKTLYKKLHNLPYLPIGMALIFGCSSSVIEFLINNGAIVYPEYLLLLINFKHRHNFDIQNCNNFMNTFKLLFDTIIDNDTYNITDMIVIIDYINNNLTFEIEGRLSIEILEYYTDNGWTIDLSNSGKKIIKYSVNIIDIMNKRRTVLINNVIHNITSNNIRKDMNILEFNEAECCICLGVENEKGQNDVDIGILQCSHFVCKSCINLINNLCPYCRTPFRRNSIVYFNKMLSITDV